MSADSTRVRRLLQYVLHATNNEKGHEHLVALARELGVWESDGVNYEQLADALLARRVRLGDAETKILARLGTLEREGHNESNCGCDGCYDCAVNDGLALAYSHVEGVFMDLKESHLAHPPVPPAPEEEISAPLGPLTARVRLQCPEGHLRTITTTCACAPVPPAVSEAMVRKEAERVYREHGGIGPLEASFSEDILIAAVRAGAALRAASPDTNKEL
jgi:hypothetical protein